MSEPQEPITLPEGRLINHSLFVMDQYNDAAKPSYKVELAFVKGALDGLFDKCLDFAIETWGAGADDDVIIPIKDGDDMAADRESRGKPGDAYKGMEVVRASTLYNKHGEEGPGGVKVYNEEGGEVGAAASETIYRGSMGQLAITLVGYQTEVTKEDGSKVKRNAITFYIVAYQKTGEGERLVSASDHSKLFKAVGRAAAKDEGSKRSRRKG